MPTKHYDLATDLIDISDLYIPSQKAVKDAIDNILNSISIVDNVKISDSSTIIDLEKDYNVYYITQTSTAGITLDLSLMPENFGSCTFYCKIKHTFLGESIGFNLSMLTWENENLDTSKLGTYLFAFRTEDSGLHWRGNLLYFISEQNDNEINITFSFTAATETIAKSTYVYFGKYHNNNIINNKTITSSPYSFTIPTLKGEYFNWSIGSTETTFTPSSGNISNPTEDTTIDIVVA